MNIRHIVALLSKFLIVLCISFSTLTMFFGVPVGNILWMSALITVIGYVVGDLYVLKKLGNFNASIIDIGFVFIVLLLFADPYVDTPRSQIYGAALTAVIIGIAEFVYHMFIEVTNPTQPSKADVNERNYAVEAGDDFIPSKEFLPSENNLMNEEKNQDK